MKQYIRTCPKCNRELVHINKHLCLSGIKNKRQCNKCFGKTQRGKIVSEETKTKQKLNRGDTSGINNPNYGKVSVLRGKTWEQIRTKESIEVAKKRLSQGLFSGHKHTEESKEKTRQKTGTGPNNHFYGKTHTNEFKQKNRIKALNQLKIKKNSTNEIRFESYLKQLGIRYRKQEIFAFWSFDFYLFDYDIYVECDGDYWHSNPNKFLKGPITSAQKKNYANDRRKNDFMKKNNKTLLRFWETDIFNNLEFVINQLLNQIMK